MAKEKTPDSSGKERAPKPRALFIAGFVGVGIALLLLFILSFTRQHREDVELKERQAKAQAGERVEVAVATLSATTRTASFTGETRPYNTVTLYAKVSGYLKEITVDKGDRVSAGQKIAVIDSPELTSQYLAALADAKNKRLFAEREESLLKEGFVSRQEADNALTSARAAEETAAGYRTQKEYQVLRAPFDGVVTARFADPGALLQAATAGATGALALVTVSRLDRLRVFIYLDQKSAGQVRLGDLGSVADVARPELKVPAPVARISGELDPKTRTMLAELDLMNAPQSFLAGSFVQVTLTLNTPPYPQVPVAALITHKEKPQVAVVGRDNRITFREVAVADSDGKMVRIGEGIAEGDRVALNPGTNISEGQLVQPVLPKKKP